MKKTIWRALILLLLFASVGAGAADYPSRPLKIVVPFGPGGATDLVARVLAENLQAQLGQPAVVENRPGASTAIGAVAVASAPADGYTLLVSGSSTYTVVPALKAGLPYVPLQSFDLLAVVADAPMVLVVDAKSPLQSTAELVARARSKPGALSYATFGPGSAPHLVGEMFALAAQAKLLAVPYRGSAPAVLALMGGEIDMAIDTLSSALPHIQAGKLRALAVFGKTRVPQLPNVATVAEQGLPGATFGGWYGVALPAGTPQAVKERLASAIQVTMATESVRTTFDKSALQAVFVPEPAFRARVEQEIKTFREVGQRAHIVME